MRTCRILAVSMTRHWTTWRQRYCGILFPTKPLSARFPSKLWCVSLSRNSQVVHIPLVITLLSAPYRRFQLPRASEHPHFFLSLSTFQHLTIYFLLFIDICKQMFWFYLMNRKCCLHIVSSNFHTPFNHFRHIPVWLQSSTYWKASLLSQTTPVSK